jgi:hypothetical protein
MELDAVAFVADRLLWIVLAGLCVGVGLLPAIGEFVAVGHARP